MKKQITPWSKQLDRRTFLKFSGALSMNAMVLGIPLAAEAVKFNRKMLNVSQSHRVMGSAVNMIVLNESRWQAENAIGRAYTEIKRLSSLLTCHQENSPIGQLNATGSLKNCPSEVMEVLEASVHFHHISRGSFDITVKPAVDFYREDFGKITFLQDDEELQDIVQRIGSKNLRLSQRSVKFARKGMSVTLDGIAKGYILDRAMETLRKQGMEHALISAGRDMVVYGGKDHKKAWRIALPDYSGRKSNEKVISLRSGALATSSSYEVYFDGQKLMTGKASTGRKQRLRQHPVSACGPIPP